MFAPPALSQDISMPKNLIPIVPIAQRTIKHYCTIFSSTVKKIAVNQLSIKLTAFQLATPKLSQHALVKVHLDKTCHTILSTPLQIGQILSTSTCLHSNLSLASKSTFDGTFTFQKDDHSEEDKTAGRKGIVIKLSRAL